MLPCHLDDLAGILFDSVLRLLSERPHDTSAELSAYEGLALDVLFPAPHSIPVARIATRWCTPCLVCEDIVLPSLHEPIAPLFRDRYRTDYPEIHTVYARRIRPTGARHRPRLMYIHGYLQPETIVEEVALLGAMALWLDVEVIQLQVPYHGRRAPRGALFSGQHFWTADLVRSVEALRQSLLDARTLLGWLLAEEDRPVGIMGLSLGGALTAALTCMDNRFAFAVPMIGHMDLTAMLADVPLLAGVRRDLRAFGWELERFRQFIERIGWNDLRPRLPANRIHLFAASDDHFFAPAAVTAMWRRWGEPEIHWYANSHLGFLLRLPEVMGQLRRIVDLYDPTLSAP